MRCGVAPLWRAPQPCFSYLFPTPWVIGPKPSIASEAMPQKRRVSLTRSARKAP